MWNGVGWSLVNTYRRSFTHTRAHTHTHTHTHTQYTWATHFIHFNLLPYYVYFIIIHFIHTHAHTMYVGNAGQSSPVAVVVYIFTHNAYNYTSLINA